MQAIRLRTRLVRGTCLDVRTEAEWKSKSLMQSRLLVTLTAKMSLPDTNEDSMKESNCNLPCRDVVEKFPSPFVNSLLERESIKDAGIARRRRRSNGKRQIGSDNRERGSGSKFFTRWECARCLFSFSRVNKGPHCSLPFGLRVSLVQHLTENMLTP